MRNIHKYIMLFVMAFAVASCTEEEIVEDKVLGKPGEEVKFTLSLDKKSRTAYDKETNNTFPIYWVDGDKVQVYSPQALTGRNNAEYKVILPANVEKPNYAENLEKTGDYGVQWGNGDVYVDDENVKHTGVHDFYSIYPSGNYEFSKVSNEDGSFSMVASGLKVAERQTINFEKGTYVHEMSNCLMYATTPKVDMGVGVVDLSYNPLSTVLWFELPAKEQATPQDPKKFMILGVELESTSTIAGTFKFNVSNGSFKSWQTEAKKITISAMDKSGTQELSHSVTAGTTFEFPVFLAPGAVNLEDMTITVVTDKGTYKKKLDKTLTVTNDNHALTAGMIHKIKLPKMSVTAEGWDVSTWMKYIPRNVYLSEVSIPGSWNSINPDFQTCASTDAQTIQNQYNQGVRAFHLDTRWKAKYSGGFIGFGQTVTVLGLGVADGGDNGSATSGTWTSGDKYMQGDGTPLVSDIISQLVGFIKNNPEEYIVLVCSFAQESIDYEGSNGKWYGEISAICNNSDYVDYIVDATTITNETLVGDVLGKILVIVNMPNAITATNQLPSNSKCMFTYMSSELDKSIFTTGNSATTTSEYLLDKNNNTLWSSAQASNVSMYNNQAQISSSTGTGIDHDRGYAPSMDERSKVLNSILDWSKSNIASTDKWIYLGLGGYQVNKGGNAGSVSGSYSTIASTYNNWINNRVTEMGQIPEGKTEVVPFYPVGIALMNFVNDYQSTVENILLLNNKYRLQYDSTKPVDYRPNDSQGGEGGDAM